MTVKVAAMAMAFDFRPASTCLQKQCAAHACKSNVHEDSIKTYLDKSVVLGHAGHLPANIPRQTGKLSKSIPYINKTAAI